MLHLDHQGHAQRTMFTQSTLSIPPFLRTHRCGTLKWRDPMQNNVFFFSGSPFLQFEHWPTWAIRGNYHPFLMEKIGLSWKSIYKKSMVLTIKHRGFQRILFPVLNLFRTASHLGHLAEACHWRFNKSWGFVRQYSGDQVHLGWAAGNLHVFKMVVYHHYHKNLPGESLVVFGCGENLVIGHWNWNLWDPPFNIYMFSHAIPYNHTYKSYKSNKQPPDSWSCLKYSVGYFRSYRILLEICMLAYLAFPHFWTSP